MYWIDSAKHFKTPGRQYFLMDSDNDVANLPTIVSEGVKQKTDNVSCQKVTVGSMAYSIASGDRFILNSQSIWKKMK